MMWALAVVAGCFVFQGMVSADPEYKWHPFQIITDLDGDSVLGNKSYVAYLRSGQVYADPSANPPRAALLMDDEVYPIVQGVNELDRGFELSTLIHWNGRMLSGDDRTGIIYELDGDSEPGRYIAIPWILLNAGNGHEPGLFKCEWSVIKDGYLWIGSHGVVVPNKDGSVKTRELQYIKRVSPDGGYISIDWGANFDKLRAAAGIDAPGYLINEAVGWSDILQRWVFLPRKATTAPFKKNNKAFDAAGANIMLIATEDFSDIQLIHVGVLNPTHGFSSLKFVPGTNDQWIFAMKSEEEGKEQHTYAMVFDIQGNILVPEQRIDGKYKFEGTAFRP